MASLPTANKKVFVRDMFDSIAPRYDMLNRILSGGIDQQWRRKAIAMLKDAAPSRILDVATGTGDLAILAASLEPDEIVGVDIAEEMLQVGRVNIEKKGLSRLIKMKSGDAEQLPFSDGAFDAALVAFGVRNFEDLSAGLTDINRVLKPGGTLVVLEFSRPTHFPIKQLYGFYGKYILPTIGKLISGDDAAYTYLPESIEVFPDGERFLDVMRDSGFTASTQKRLTFGIASLYSGRASG